MSDIIRRDPRAEWIARNRLHPLHAAMQPAQQSWMGPNGVVRKNMSFALDLAGVDKKLVESKVSEAARILELGPLLERKPKQLSGGQRQRVAIGRAIVRNPKIFLFDEPLSNLDAALRVQMRLELARLHKELQATMIYVTHDQVEAMTLADKVVVLNSGRIEQVGSPLELMGMCVPNSSRVARVSAISPCSVAVPWPFT